MTFVLSCSDAGPTGVGVKYRNMSASIRVPKQEALDERRLVECSFESVWTGLE